MAYVVAERGRVSANPLTAIISDENLEPEMHMPTKTVTVGSSAGLHVRPAAIISDAARRLGSEVTLAVPGDGPVDAASSLLVMTLGAACGDSVEVSGEDQAAVDAIAALVEQDLDA